MASKHNLWQIKIHENTHTNCAVPQYILNNALRFDDVKLPLLFRITDPATKKFAISVADDFFETANTDALEMKISPVVAKYLNISDCAFVEMINKTPDSDPPKAKQVLLEPQDELFYKLKNPQKVLEKYLKHSYIIGVGYMIPLELKIQLKTQLKIKIVNMRVAKLTDYSDKDVNFANINNLDLGVDFLPIPENLRSKKKNTTVPKKKLIPKITAPNLPQSNSETQPKNDPCQTEQNPLYDPSKHWVPFCGWKNFIHR